MTIDTPFVIGGQTKMLFLYFLVSRYY